MINVTNLTISLVVHKPDLEQLHRTLTSLLSSLEHANVMYHLYIIDNTPKEYKSGVNDTYINKYFNEDRYSYIRTEQNLGFGVAHNQALNVQSDFHLIINPDLDIELNAIKSAIQFMSNNECCGLLTPSATWGDGSIQRLCKEYPSVLVLLLRGFAPTGVKKVFKRSLDQYEMADLIRQNEVYWNPPMVSGCFMFFRTEIWKKCNGFDNRFFLYFEDFDLSIRTRQFSDIAYVPSVKIIHHGGYAARKGLKHILLFFRSMLLFFKIHHWKWF